MDGEKKVGKKIATLYPGTNGDSRIEYEDGTVWDEQAERSRHFLTLAIIQAVPTFVIVLLLTLIALRK